MDSKIQELILHLSKTHHLPEAAYACLIRGCGEEASAYAAQLAVPLRRQIYGTDVYVRGLIEISNICRNDCLYCGIRRSNKTCVRYRLSPQEILECCEEGYSLGFRTFVLQGGEDGFYTDELLCELLRTIKAQFPDCAVTLSLGERNHESYKRLFDAGADRYLLDQVRGRMSFTETLDAMRGLSSKWPQTTRKLVEDKANGTAVIDVLKKEIPGIIPVEPFGGKVVRAHATTAVAEAGNVYIPAASACPWVMDFVEEMAAFPSGAHDDQVDCYSQANAYYNDNTFDIRSLIT